MKKILAMVLSLALVATMAITGSIAYLQDTDEAVNVMTLGNVYIDQHEYERALNEDGTYKTDTIDNQTSYVLKDFKQGKPLYPIVGDPNEPGNSPAYAGWDDTIVRMTQVDSYGSMQVFAGKNAQDKFVTVENTGKSDAYVRTLVAIEIGSSDGAKIMTSARAQEEGDTGTAPWIKNSIGNIVIEDNTYKVVEYVYRGASDVNRHVNGILPKGDTTYPNLCQVYLKHNATNEDMDAIDGNKNGALDILVLSQAVQTAGFADAKTALDTAFGKSADKAAEWFGGMTVAPEMGENNILELEENKTLIDEPLYSNYTATEAYTINGNGHTVTGVATSADVFTWEGGTIPAMSTIFSSKDGAKVTVNDLNFEGTISAIMLGNYVNSSSNWFNTELNNVNVIGTEVVSFSANVSPAVCVYGTAVLNDCNIYGTTLSELDTDPMWPVYDLVAVNYSDTTINGGKIGSFYVWNQAKATIADGAEVETLVVRGNMNTTKYGVTIKADATVNQIDLSAITDKTRVNITIEDGATVGKIVANGLEYKTIAEWQAA